MPQLDNAGQTLLVYLVGKLAQAIPGDPRTFVGYKEVHDDLGLPTQGPFGVSLKNQGLESLAIWTRDMDLPGITGLVVDRSTLEPGQGFFNLFGWEDDQYRRWAEEIRRSKELDWSPYLAATLGDERPTSTDKQGPASAPTSSFGASSVWRLIAHHEHVDAAIAEMVRRGVLAVGWTGVGPIDAMAPRGAAEISEAIGKSHPQAQNAHLGGPSLWNLYSEIRVGDLVIVGGDNKRKLVMEVVSDYFFSSDGVLGYAHQRGAVLTGINADELWLETGGNVDTGQNIRWTLARLTANPTVRELIYQEGTKFEVRSTAIERNPAARAACITHYGPSCFVCKFDFEAVYGELGKGYIHVHHRKNIALSQGLYDVNPIEDLVPLCPNCHSMVHRAYPAMDVEGLRQLIRTQTP